MRHWVTEWLESSKMTKEVSHFQWVKTTHISKQASEMFWVFLWQSIIPCKIHFCLERDVFGLSHKVTVTWIVLVLDVSCHLWFLGLNPGCLIRTSLIWTSNPGLCTLWPNRACKSNLHFTEQCNNFTLVSSFFLSTVWSIRILVNLITFCDPILAGQ